MQKLVLNGYVIHRRAYRETSLLVDFFTRESGKVSAVAKGARGNSKSERKSLLQPLQYIEFECAGRTNLKNLGHLDSLDNALSLKGKALYSAFYINEIIQRALPEGEAFEHLFGIYQQTLHSLAGIIHDTNDAIEPILRQFEFALLENLGYLPDFSSNATNGEAIAEAHYYKYELEHGFVRCEASAVHAISGTLLHEISNGNLSLRALKVAKYIVRVTLPLAIGDKPLKSRELFSQL
ncbi:DNA repair protein RecO [Agaribacter flavus]|uniref:DNA repair protein RecO n=1 Tax=Agaribacter flavus TaxID=1902781 RepID=A0ABV7FP21_9ALTE